MPSHTNFALGNEQTISKQARIAIVGAGPAGLSAAYYLKQYGYKHVVVLERLGRVGGLCRTITEDGYSFDLGANYVTSAYKRVRKLAREHDAKLYSEIEGGVLQFDPDDGDYGFREIWDVVRNGGGGDYISACVRFWRLRRNLSHVIDAPGFAEVEKHPSLCVSFAEWLRDHDLERLIPLFEIPITVMGYGYVRCPNCKHPTERALKEIPAPYALKYMNLRTFRAMVIKFSPAMRWFWWPKRFVYGYQRLWECVATKLDVRLNIDIHRIQRSDTGVCMTFTQKEQFMNATRQSCPVSMDFDYLILTCPLSLDVLGRSTEENSTMLDLAPEESELFGKILTYSYALASCSIDPESWPKDWPRILCTVPPTEEGLPWAITRQMKGSSLTQFYLHLPESPLDYEARQRQCGCNTKPTEAGGPFIQGMQLSASDLPEGVRRFVQQTGMRILNDRWHTYDHWPYFQHVTAKDMRERFYTKLEGLQGRRRTFYGGALMNFELVENVMEYSEHLVLKHFLKRIR